MKLSDVFLFKFCSHNKDVQLLKLKISHITITWILFPVYLSVCTELQVPLLFTVISLNSYNHYFFVLILHLMAEDIFPEAQFVPLLLLAFLPHQVQFFSLQCGYFLNVTSSFAILVSHYKYLSTKILFSLRQNTVHNFGLSSRKKVSMKAWLFFLSQSFWLELVYSMPFETHVVFYASLVHHVVSKRAWETHLKLNLI